MVEILIVCGGTPSIPSYMKEKLLTASDKVFPFIVAVDSGADLLFSLDRIPNLLVGDLDSISPGASQWINDNNVKQITFPSEKAASDLELALDEIKKLITPAASQPEKPQCTLIGALGKRVDHQLFNLQVLTQDKYNDLNFVVKDKEQTLYLIRADQPFVLLGSPGESFSLIPMTPEFSISSLTGAKWNLTDELISFGSSRTLSNEFAGDEITVQIKSGKCYLAHSL